MSKTEEEIRQRCPRCTFDYAVATTGAPADRYHGVRFPEDLATDARGYPCCPACGKQSLYDWGSDRLLHTDGTDNDACWIAINHGEAREWKANQP